MDSATVEAVTGWDSGPFTDGHAGLRDLADREFTGAVTNGSAWLFMLNGRVVGVFDGSIDAFEDADGTAYEAPHAALPLLYAMQETGGETRANYYTEKTPLTEVDSTLKGGNFTGYVELSENVLSGDYYTVYQGGKSMSVAFVGNNQRLITDDEAFQRAADEVGIYEVKTVDVEIVDIPNPEPSETDGAAGGAVGTTGGAGASSATTDGTSTGAPGADESADAAHDSTADRRSQTDAASDDASTADPGQGGVTFGGGDPLAEDQSESSAADPLAEDGSSPPTSGEETTSSPSEDPLAGPPGSDESTDETSGGTQTAPRDEATTQSTDETVPPATEEPAPVTEEYTAATDPADQRESSATSAAETGPATEIDSSADPSTFDDEANWRESRTIPALDPEQTGTAADSGANAAASSSRQSQSPSADQSREGGQDTPRQQSQETPGEGGQSRQRLQEVESSLEAVRSERDRLAERVEELEAERERLSETSEGHQRELERLKQERDEATRRVSTLEATVSELESTVESLERELAEAREAQAESTANAGGQSVPPDRAYEGTNLFVRYSSKSGPTLDDAFDGTASREEVNENIRLEHHTDFDADDVVVADRPFEDWLENTIEFGFSRWLVTEFIHDIRETRNQSALESLYEAIPEVDRIEFHGTVEVPTPDGGSEGRTFDVVIRDRMGDPLVVANLNDSREPATESMVDSLVEGAAPIGEMEARLAGAFFVTTSYFEPGALETAHDATGGGLLRRDRRKSFVKLSRKGGYHLCLVETRNGEFHVNVPEL